jgi:hypothetical protein
MAKSKRSSALFEVMNKANAQSPRPRRSGFATPLWWFKKRPDGTSTSQAPISPASTTHAPSIQPSSSLPDAPDSTVRIDRDRQTLSISFTSAIVLAVAVVVVIALAIILGQQLGGQTQRFTNAEPSTLQLQSGPANPAVANPRTQNQLRNEIPGLPAGSPSGAESTAELTAALQPTPGQSIADATAGAAANPAASPAANTPPAPAGPREVNLNYVIFQSYPDEASAKEVVDLLTKNGLPATIERRLRGYTANWYTVVGTQGFVRLRGPEYDAYLTKIRTVNDQLKKEKKNFKVFTPLPYKWDKPAAPSR